MKRKIYSLLVFGLLIGSAACRKGFEDLNRPYSDADDSRISIPGLYNGMVESFTKYGDDALNVSLLYPITNQQAYQNTLAPYVNYAGGYWGQYYPVLQNYRQLMMLIDKQPDKAAFTNVRSMATILLASRTLRMLDYYGDIPYSQAVKAADGSTNFRPAYDKQADVYKSVLADLKTAVEGLTSAPGQTSIGASESFLKNDLEAWRKFGNALRLRYAVRLYNKENALSSGIITDIIGGNKPLPNNQSVAAADIWKDNFGLWPTNFSNAGIFAALDAKWNSYAELSISNMRMSSNVWQQLSSSNDSSGAGIFDPRTYVWFMTSNRDKWAPQPQDGSQSEGGRPFEGGMTTRRAIGADIANKFSAVNFNLAADRVYYPILIITEADVHFLKAEIYQRGMGVAKDIVKAKAEYEAGLKASVNFWYGYTNNSSFWPSKPAAPTAGQMIAFLTNPKVLYNGANDADALRKIATQAWLATMFQPWEAWAIVRRTGLTPKDPNYTPSVVNKLPYPDDETINNHDNWQKATNGASPGQQVLQKVYWMP
ncbi:SusD/RagB family nutrient-binding outer membrane lipoprotein [Chitinophaga deserti]|uniref:SusD/RagB family nutrient-binding outer membrane lipoprotein n=1 Tax=Chitinophaga deserti TaxID=2164099 RepID=UPI000D6C30A0|nr:SusD/RagB family nutrient-binding outer membrane lipoprotein [Chitinophaga deserti]